MRQVTDTVLMVRPAAFAYNAETAADNHFQQEPSLSSAPLQEKVLEQFNAMVDVLRSHGINVWVVDDTPEPPKPDAIFPNNWLSTNTEGRVNVFPMYARSRRLEKRDDLLQQLAIDFTVTDLHDWSEYEAEAHYLEGTGSMVMDHANQVIYACTSARTHRTMVEKFAAVNGYRAMVFDAHDSNGKPIYHTNVMMCIGETFAVLCPKAITDDTERIAVAQLLETTGHENIYITHEQMNAFAGNMLQLKNSEGEKFIVLSATALRSLRPDQVERLSTHGALLPIDVSTIEEVEGGSVRCMMAELFLEKRKA
jgi:hypothetical protein